MRNFRRLDGDKYRLVFTLLARTRAIHSYRSNLQRERDRQTERWTAHMENKKKKHKYIRLSIGANREMGREMAGFEICPKQFMFSCNDDKFLWLVSRAWGLLSSVYFFAWPLICLNFTFNVTCRIVGIYTNRWNRDGYTQTVYRNERKPRDSLFPTRNCS